MQQTAVIRNFTKGIHFAGQQMSMLQVLLILQMAMINSSLVTVWVCLSEDRCSVVESFSPCFVLLCSMKFEISFHLF